MFDWSLLLIYLIYFSCPFVGLILIKVFLAIKMQWSNTCTKHGLIWLHESFNMKDI